MTTSRTYAPALAGIWALAGALHLARPALYDGLVPRALGAARPWVLASGVAELACAALVATPRTRRLGGYASAALLVAVLPGNVEMAVRLRRRRGAARVLAWLRVPLQAPLVLWALTVARGG